MREARFHTVYKMENGQRVDIPALKGKDADEYKKVLELIVDEQVTQLDIDLSEQYSDVISYEYVNPAIENVSNANSMFLTLLDNDGATMTTAFYVNNGVGGTTDIASSCHFTVNADFIRAHTSRQGAGILTLCSDNNTGKKLRYIRYSGNYIRFFGVGTRFIIYAR